MAARSANDKAPVTFDEGLELRVEWLKTVPFKDAVKEKGFLGNQNSAAKPRAKNWAFTLDRLRQRFGIDNGE